MYFHLHNLCIHLQSDDSLIKQYWRYLFAGWLSPKADHIDMRLTLQLVPQLPPLPTTPPYFTDNHDLPDNIGILSVYQQDDEHVLLHYLDGALVTVPLYDETPPTPCPKAKGVLLKNTLNYGRFEDVIFTSLAPLLRRHGYYLVHAFAASKNGRAALIVGPSGSGKTTTGLCLIQHGWQLLANDILILQRRPDGIYALATPGAVSIRSHTLNLLPTLHHSVENKRPIHGKYQVTGDAFINGRWSPPTPVHTIFFPKITNQATTHVTSHNRAIALANLMEESMDRWDKQTLFSHLQLLQAVTDQATPYQANLGQDMVNVATVLEKTVTT